MIEASHRLAEERQFTPQQELVVLLALERIANTGETEADRLDASNIIQRMFSGRVEEVHQTAYALAT